MPVTTMVKGRSSTHRSSQGWKIRQRRLSARAGHPTLSCVVVLMLTNSLSLCFFHRSRSRQAKQGLGRGQDRAQEAASKDRGRRHCRSRHPHRLPCLRPRRQEAERRRNQAPVRNQRPHPRLGSRRRLRSCVGRLLPVHQGAWCWRGGRRRWWTLSVNRAVLCAREGSIRSPGPFETRRRKGGGEVQSRAIKTKQKRHST